MLTLPGQTKIYIACGHTDMRKGIHGLLSLIEEWVSKPVASGALYVFRGKRSDRIKIVWYDGQGFCLFCKVLERGRFIWPSSDATGVIGLTGAQLSMLIEAVDWRNPVWTSAPERIY